ncbi:HAD family phosphatase [Photobacterium sp. SDRW27]|uniref:HAD family hydrolase n=1 Tax=Photobacterium obscurum TaxID=2829490 RepID=UPI002244E7A4|nr:HAD family phosphatase [Photobacterium obscurum]MCW8327690.1 HAD family phosphatase [Photobacterium obscurum]
MQAICFDFDGTLVDSEVFHASNWSAYLAQCGTELTSNEFLRDYAGVTWDKVAGALQQRFSLDITIEQMLVQMELITRNALRHGKIPAKAGVDNMLRQLHGQVPLAVVTGAPREYVEGILHLHGWLDMFEHIFCGEDVSNNKPAPDIYHLACETLGYKATQVIAIEDSFTGVKSACSAGLKVVLVNDEQPDWRIIPDYHFTTMFEAHPVVMGLVQRPKGNDIKEALLEAI